MSTNHFIHLLDDLAMGGVTRALENFKHPALTTLGNHEVFDINRALPRNKLSGATVIIHFTANWRKLPRLFDLRMRRKCKQIILIEHSYTSGFERHNVENIGRFRQMLRLTYALVDTVVAVSGAQRDWMLAADLVSPEKVVCIPQARDCSKLHEIEHTAPRSGQLNIGAYGRFHQQKGFDLLLQAMEGQPDHIQLKLAGSGDDAGLLKTLAMRSPNVTIVPAFKSPEAFLRSVDIVAIPSRWEAFGLVGLEARAAGRPILAADIDGLSDQIGISGFRHTAGNICSLRQAIQLAASVRDLGIRGALAREEVAGAYENMIAGWQILLGESQPIPLAA
ncbi:MAG: glycosyltransferase family 4 protein [Pseudomonadota bacterium]